MNDTVNFWRNICLESHFQSKIILKALQSKQTKSTEPKLNVRNYCLILELAQNFLFHKTQWVSLPLRVVCHTALWTRVCSMHIWQELPRMYIGPRLPDRTCCVRAQPWLMAAGKSLCSWLKAAPLGYQKGNYCIPVVPRAVSIHGTSVRFGLGKQHCPSFLEGTELWHQHRLEYWPLVFVYLMLGNNRLGMSLRYFSLQVLPLKKV